MTRTLIITGASRGIGKATAELFLQNHWHVINLSRTPCPLNAVQNIKADLSTTDWKITLTNELRKRFADREETNPAHRICLIHNAGHYQAKHTIDELTPEDLRESLEVNCVAPIIINQIVQPYMAPGSAILYLGSTLSTEAVKGAASYIIGKHAVLGMMRVTCKDLAGTGIHTACICPGFTETDMMRKHLKNDEALIATMKNKIVYGRMATPKEIAELLWFAGQHPVINGSALHANLGGLTS